jgi:hypothetical protein
MNSRKMLGISALLALTVLGQTADAQSGRMRRNNGNGNANSSGFYRGNGNQGQVRLRSPKSGWGDASLIPGFPCRPVHKPCYKPYYFGNNHFGNNHVGNNLALLRWRLHGCGSLGWWSSLPTYGQASYSAVYPGIDLIYYGNPFQSGYQFIVAPGANPYQIVFLYDGLDNCYLSGQGDLILRTAGGIVVHKQPLLYQEINGIRQSVSGHYVLRGNGRVGFEIGSYDRSLPLIIARR